MIVCCLRKFPQFTSVIELLHSGWEISFGILLLYVLQKKCPHWANFCNIMGRMFLCFSLFVFTMDTMSRVASDVLIDDSTTPSPTTAPTHATHILRDVLWSGVFPESSDKREIGGLDDVSCGFGEQEFRTLYAIWFTLYLVTFLRERIRGSQCSDVFLFSFHCVTTVHLQPRWDRMGANDIPGAEGGARHVGRRCVEFHVLRLIRNVRSPGDNDFDITVKGENAIDNPVCRLVGSMPLRS